MARIAIVEDDQAEAETLEHLVGRYAEASGRSFNVVRMSSADDLVEAYRSVFDLILFDIELPGVNGMQAAASIRALDPHVVIVFVTSMARYAIAGYKVGALDYLLKPVTYSALRATLDRVCTLLDRNKEVYLTLPAGNQKVRVATSDVLFAEIRGHELSVVTRGGTYRMRESLGAFEERLGAAAASFARCNQCYLVNLANVTSVGPEVVDVCGHSLRISRPRRKLFLAAYADWLGAEL